MAPTIFSAATGGLGGSGRSARREGAGWLERSRVRMRTSAFGAGASGATARVWRATTPGVDGIYIFNVFNPQTAFFRECGGPQSVAGKTKHYFATIRDGRPTRYLAGGDAFRRLPILTPLQPWNIVSGRPRTLTMTISEPDGAREHGRFAAHLRVGEKAAELVDKIDVHVNGVRLEGAAVAGEWLDFPVPAAALRHGGNEIVFAAAADQSRRLDRTVSGKSNTIAKR